MDEAKRIIHSGRFHGQRDIYDSELVGLKLQYNEMTFNSPLPVACAILDLSKVIMYQFYYEGMKPFFDPDKYNCGPPEQQKCRMCYTDTDSLIIKTFMKPDENVYKDFMKSHSQYFDLSCYSSDHKIFEGLDADEIKKLQNQNKKQ